MNLPTPSTPPAIKGTLNAVGNEWSQFTRGYQNAGKSLERVGNRIGQSARSLYSAAKQPGQFSVKGIYQK